MKKLYIVAIAFIAALAPALMAPSGGFPSRPKFQTVSVGTGTALTATSATHPLVAKVAGGATVDMRVDNGTRWVGIGVDGSSAYIESLTGNPLYLYAGGSPRLKIFNTGGLTVGSPPGGDQGATTLNAGALFQGGVQVAQTYAVDFAAGASPSIAASFNLTSPGVTRPGTGQYALTWNAIPAFNALIASCSFRNSPGTGAYLIYESGASTTGITLNFLTGGVLTNPSGAVQCLLTAI